MVFTESIAVLIAEKTRDRLASIHIDAIGLIRLGKTNEERLDRFDRIICLAESKGGNIMIPTFSYTFPKEEIFDVLETPSDVGLVTEFLRKRHPHKRTADPFFSYLVFGEKGFGHYEVRDYECFGEDSLIGDLFSQGGYICCVGNVFHNTPTEVHYIEKLIGVEYRFNKMFQGVIRGRDGRQHLQTTTFYCRKYVDELFPDMTRLDRDLREAKLFEFWRVPEVDFVVQAISVEALYDFVRRKIAEDPLYLCSTLKEYESNLRNRRGWLFKSEFV